LIRPDFRRQKFYGDWSIQLGVIRQIDFAHSAFANLGSDFIATETCAGG
jgi:hypothetical protein